MAQEKLKITLVLDDKASGGLRKFEGSLEDFEKQTKSSINSFDGFSLALTGINQGLELVGKAIQATKQVWNFAKEGAEIEMVKSRFDRLAASIGVTGDVLMGDLKQATSGLIDDLNLMTTAVDLMTLGLVKNREEAIRMTKVASELGMDMNQLVLTLTNMTTMRFDALGLQVDGFDEKVKKLEKSGLDAATAFREAFLQQAEEQIERVGSIAEQSISSFQRLETQINNVGLALQMGPLGEFVEHIAAGLADRLETIGALNRLLQLGAISQAEWNERVREASEIGWSRALAEARTQLEGVRAGLAAIDEETAGADRALRKYAGTLKETIPDELTTKVTLDDSQALEDIWDLGEIMRKWARDLEKDLAIRARVEMMTPGERIGGGGKERGVFRQHGGPLNLEGWTLVGERGFELITPWGYVLNHELSRELMRSGLAPTFQYALDIGGTVAAPLPITGGPTTSGIPKEPGKGPTYHPALETEEKTFVQKSPTPTPTITYTQIATGQAIKEATSESVETATRTATEVASAQTHQFRAEMVYQRQQGEEQTKLLREIRDRLNELPSVDEMRDIMYETTPTSGF